MSEKQQHNAAWTHQAMDNRYGDLHHHKHDKRHNAYRLHAKTHPVQFHAIAVNDEEMHDATGAKRELNLQKIRKRVVRKQFYKR